MRESGNLPPEAELEARASVYKITPYKISHGEIVKSYNDNEMLRWSLNKNNFNIKIWIADEGDHKEIDPAGSRDGTIGYIDQKHGFFFSDEDGFNKKSKAELVYAIKKYLNI